MYSRVFPIKLRSGHCIAVATSDFECEGYRPAQIKRLYRRGTNLRELAERFGVSPVLVRKLLRLAKIDYVLDLYGQYETGKTCTEIARENTIYTSTTFYIWLKWLKGIRGALWILAAASGAGAASTVLKQSEENQVLVAGLALLAVIIPGAIKALKLDDTILDYETAAAKFKNAEGTLRRAANVWSHKPFSEFEIEAREALSDLDNARNASLTPPEFCFKAAQRKVASGDYDPDNIEGGGN